MKILPEIELLAGVQSQTSWLKSMGPDGRGNKYFQSLQAFFEPYKNHRAVKLSQKFTDNGFNYDAPIALICHLGPLPNLELQYEYSDYLCSRARGREPLEEFRMALKDLAAESNFSAFYQDWETYLNGVLAKSEDGFRRKEIEKWLTDFFGLEMEEFHLIMAPGMFPGGGYGATVTTNKGTAIGFQIFCDWGTSDDEPVLPKGIALENLTVHELSHSFVNPSLGAYTERLQRLGHLYEPVREIMVKQAYGNVDVFFYETVIRAVEILFAREFFPPNQEEEILAFHKEWGFYLIDYMVEILEYYQANRNTYPIFAQFVPVLYDRLDLY